MASKLPELPKGWEWHGDNAARVTPSVSLGASLFGDGWYWTVWPDGARTISGTAPDAPSAARAAEAAVVEWASGLIREVTGKGVTLMGDVRVAQPFVIEGDDDAE